MRANFHIVPKNYVANHVMLLSLLLTMCQPATFGTPFAGTARVRMACWRSTTAVHNK